MRGVEDRAEQESSMRGVEDREVVATEEEEGVNFCKVVKVMYVGIFLKVEEST
jgi:hypothetical protein